MKLGLGKVPKLSYKDKALTLRETLKKHFIFDKCPIEAWLAFEDSILKPGQHLRPTFFQAVDPPLIKVKNNIVKKLFLGRFKTFGLWLFF